MTIRCFLGRAKPCGRKAMTVEYERCGQDVRSDRPSIDSSVLVRFVSKYTEQQREALAGAFVDDGVRPANRVVEMAALGKLEVRGQRVEPFEAHPDSVRHFARVLRKRRANADTSELLAAPPQRAVEILRRRLVALVEMETQRIERQQADPAAPPVPGEVLRQLARALREIAALPGPTDERPLAPGEKRDGVRIGGETRGGLAARALALHRERRRETDEREQPSEPA